MIEVVEETASTNADLAQRLRAGEHVPEDHWLRALRQTAGRGRRGREWVSPEGNLACSTVVEVRVSDPPVHTLAFVAGLAVFDAVEATLEFGGPASGDFVDRLPADASPRCLLKWPNDLLVDGAKIAGILLERVGEHVVIGAGINVSGAPDVPGRVTTSLRAAGSDADAAAVLNRLASRFAARLAQWRSQGLAEVLADWQGRATPPGTPLLVTLDDEGALTGTFAGLATDGALRLRLADGSLRVVHAGDVSLV